MLKGALHVHSTYSDGDLSLAALRELFLGEGCRFVCMSDHADAFDSERAREYAAACESLSDHRFRFIAGLEFGCERRMHILGFGVTTLVQSTDPEQVIHHVGLAGGVSVIAHPQDASFEWMESFGQLPDGIETWNTKYDGRYAPRARTFRLLHRLQRRRTDMRAFYGQDLHWARQYHGLFTIVDGESLQQDAILSSLRAGNYVALKDGLEFPSTGRLEESVLLRLDHVQRRFAGIRRLVGTLKRAAGRFGAIIPAPLKAQLRRLF